MKTLYLDCSMGAAGDMLTAALLELIQKPEAFIGKMNLLGIPGVVVTKAAAQKQGVAGTHITVTVHGVEEGEHEHEHEHEHHGSMHEIEHIVGDLPVSGWVKTNALAVYHLIAEAESEAHGVPVSQVHFHEVGAMDAIADVVAVCLLLEQLAPQKICASPVHVGHGTVQCAHGVMSVPAPATANLLRGIPIYGGEVQGELCTPTGAALLRHFVGSFGEMPPISVSAIGYGMGTKDFPVANCLRAMMGEDSTGPNEHISMLSCNLDDMTGEALGFACQHLLEGGALDVFTVPITMKKSRPAHVLVCVTRQEDANRIAAEMLRHTTTFGVRRNDCSRYTLERTIATNPTPYGEIRIKTGTGYGLEKVKPEYDDVAAAAREHGLSISEVLQALGI